MLSLIRRAATASSKSFRTLTIPSVTISNASPCKRLPHTISLHQMSAFYSVNLSTSSDANSLEAFDIDESLGFEHEKKLEAKATGEFADKRPITEFDLSKTLLKNLEKAGITHLFPVQVKSFATMMNGVDIVGRSKTGSGKTLAFGLPIVEKLLQRERSSKDPGALILLPTRELAMQVASEISKISPQLRTVTVVGGVPYQVQESQLRSGVDILVGTPGRITDLVHKGKLALQDVEFAVLDEADMMLKFGFQEAVETILAWVPESRQCVMWSATFPKWVTSLSKKYLKKSISIDLVGDDQGHVPDTVTHKAMHIPPSQRIRALQNILRQYAGVGQSLVFTETKQEANDIANGLDINFVRALHGDLSQPQRASTMQAFRNGSVKTLVCTDIAARGLDIANVDLVVHYRAPSDRENFVHRAGRTGRAGRSGTSIIFFDSEDLYELKNIESRFKLQFTHACPPHVDQILDLNIGDATQRLLKVTKGTSDIFTDAASKLYAEHGVNVISSALALLCGFDQKCAQSISMLTGKSNMCTIELSGLGNAREVTDLLSKAVGASSSRDVHSVNGAFIADIPSPDFSTLLGYIKSNELHEVSAQKVQELPRLLVSASAGKSWGGNSFRRGGSSSNYRGRSSSSNYNSRNSSSGRDRDSWKRPFKSHDRSENPYSSRRSDRYDDSSSFSKKRKSSRFSSWDE